MNPIFVQCPPVPPTWPGTAAIWKALWKRIAADLYTVPLSRTEFYFAHDRMDVWVWCRGTNAVGAIEYWAWCFNFDDEEFIGEQLLPLLKNEAIVRGSALHVWIELPNVPILHVERVGNEEKDRTLHGQKVWLGRNVPEMPGGF